MDDSGQRRPETGLGFHDDAAWNFRRQSARSHQYGLRHHRKQQAKEALEATTRDIVTTWESMTDAFFSLDTQWHFTQVNSQCTKLLETTLMN
jgi:PAS domain-containing protein